MKALQSGTNCIEASKVFLLDLLELMTNDKWQPSQYFMLDVDQYGPGWQFGRILILSWQTTM